MNGMMQEDYKRLVEHYKWRKDNIKTWTPFNPASMWIEQQRQRAVLEFFIEMGLDSLKEFQILDIGCGMGYKLAEFIQFGASPENLYGIDLLDWRIEEAKRNNPQLMNFYCGSAASLPFDDEFFDMQIQYTTFSSILNNDIRAVIASEMLRTLKKDGFIIWYDMDEKKDEKHLRGIGVDEIRQMFTGCELKSRKILVDYGLLVDLLKKDWILPELYQRASIYCTHHIAIIKKL